MQPPFLISTEDVGMSRDRLQWGQPAECLERLLAFVASLLLFA